MGTSDHQRDAAQKQLRAALVSQEYIDGEEEARKKVQGLLTEIDRIDDDAMSPKQKWRQEIERQLGHDKK